MTDKVRLNPKGKHQAIGRVWYMSSIESLFRRLLEQGTCEKAEGCETLAQMLEIYIQTAQELKDMFRAVSESVTAKTGK